MPRFWRPLNVLCRLRLLTITRRELRSAKLPAYSRAVTMTRAAVPAPRLHDVMCLAGNPDIFHSTDRRAYSRIIGTCNHGTACYSFLPNNELGKYLLTSLPANVPREFWGRFQGSTAAVFVSSCAVVGSDRPSGGDFETRSVRESACVAYALFFSVHAQNYLEEHCSPFVRTDFFSHRPSVHCARLSPRPS